MVIFLSWLFVFSIARAQTPAASQAAPDVQIIKLSWNKERIDWQLNPVGSSERGNDVRTRVLTERRRGSPLQVRDDQEQSAENAKPPAPPRYLFTYKLTIHNRGQKAIKEIDWDYIFTDATTGEELGRREFTSVEKVAPGKRKELNVSVSAPPTKKISVYNLGKNEREGLVERVVILRIVFDDNTVWQAS